jgi:hypothetical protein
VTPSILWSGAAGDGQWTTAGNWQGDVLPGKNDDVVINTSPAAAVTLSSAIVTVHSLMLGVGTSLTATGPGASLTATAPATIDGSSLYALNGGSVALPATTYTNLTTGEQQEHFFQATAGGVLDLHTLTSITNETQHPGAVLSIQANGGTVNLIGVTQIADGTGGDDRGRDVYVQAVNSGSVVYLNALTSFTDTSNGSYNPGSGSSSISATQQGQIQTPALTSLQQVSITLDQNSTLNTAAVTSLINCTATLNGTVNLAKVGDAQGSQFTINGGAVDLSNATNLSYGSVTLNGGTVNLSKASDIDGASFYVSGAGLILALPAATTYTNLTTGEQQGRFFQAMAGGVLDLHTLTRITNETQHPGAVLSIQANGGTVNLSGVTQISDGTGGDDRGRDVNVQAVNPGSVVYLNALTSFTDTSNGAYNPGSGTSSLSATQQGQIQTPALTSLRQINITLDQNSTLNTAAVTSLGNCTLTLNGTVNLAKVGDAHGNQFTINGGAVNLSNVTNLSYGSVTLNGGTVNLSKASNIDGASFVVNGSGEILAVPAATTYTNLTTGEQQEHFFQATAGGVLDLHTLTRITNETQHPGAVLSIQANLGTVNLSGVKQIADGTGGDDRGRDVNVQAVNSGSVVNLNALTTFTDASTGVYNPGNGDSSLSATQGGQIQTPALTSLRQVNITLDQNSTLNTAAVTSLGNCTLTLNGTVNLAKVADAHGNQFTINGGAVNLSNVTNLSYGSVTLNGGTVNLSKASDIDGASFVVNGNGETIALPAATTYTNLTTGEQQERFFQATAGGVLDLHTLTRITNETQHPGAVLSIQANLGTVNLSGVKQIADGTGGDDRGRDVNVQAVNTGSVVNLNALTSFTDTSTGVYNLGNGYSSLTCTNGALINVSPVSLAVRNVIVTIDSTSSIAGSLNLQSKSSLVAAGTVTGNVINSSSVSTGSSPGILTITGNYTQTAAGSLTIQLGGTNAGTQYDQLAVGGTASLNGTLVADAINGFTPQDGQGFNFLSAKSRAGSFATVTPANFPTGLLPDTSYTASAAGLGVTSATQFQIAITASQTAGAPFSVTVTALNSTGGTATDFSGPVRVTSTDPLVLQLGTFNFPAANNGVLTISGLTLETAANQTLTVTAVGNPAITGSGTTKVAAGAATSFAVTGPSSVVSGATFSATVMAVDPFGNQATGYTGTVHFSSTDTHAVLPANYTFTPTDAGAHTFTFTLKTAGTQAITATDTVTSSIAGTLGSITVMGKPSQIKLNTPIANATANLFFNLTVTIEDSNGNTVTNYSGTVHFTSISDQAAKLPANYKFVATDKGSHTFQVALENVGAQTITVADTVTSSVTGTLAINDMAVFAVSAPASASSGGPFSVTVTAENGLGQIVPNYTGTIQFSSSDQTASLPASYAFTAGDAGAHTFTNAVTLFKSGNQTVTVADTINAPGRGTATVTVSAGTVSQLVVTAPAAETAGSAFVFTVTAEDNANNVVPSYTGTVQFASSDGLAALPGSYAFTTGNLGVASFAAVLYTAGSQTLTATDVANSSLTSSVSVTVNPGAATHLGVTAGTSQTAGAAFTVTVSALDAFGNTATGYTGTVQFSSTDTKPGLPASYTFKSTDNGVHAFTNGTTLVTAGTQSITATDTSKGTITGAQTGIVVSPAAASKFLIIGPSSASKGAGFIITVKIVDKYGNIVTGYNGTITFSSSDNAANRPANYQFTSADGGVHQFIFTLNTTGTQSITATDTANSGLTGTDSGISVSAAPADILFDATELAGDDELSDASVAVATNVLPQMAFPLIPEGSRWDPVLVLDHPHQTAAATLAACLIGSGLILRPEQSKENRRRDVAHPA